MLLKILLLVAAAGEHAVSESILFNFVSSANHRHFALPLGMAWLKMQKLRKTKLMQRLMAAPLPIQPKGGGWINENVADDNLLNAFVQQPDVRFAAFRDAFWVKIFIA